MKPLEYRVLKPATSEGVRAAIIAATTDGRREQVSIVIIGTHEVPRPKELAVTFQVEHFKREESGFSVFGETIDGQRIRVEISADLAEPAMAELA